MVQTNARGVGALLASLASGDPPSSAQVAAFTDLDRVDAAAVRDAWPRIPVDSRRELLALAAELSHDRVELEFSTLGRVGLEDADASVRLAAIEALWESEDWAVGGKFFALLESDPDEDVRTAAAAGLGPFVLQREAGGRHEEAGDAMVAALLRVAADASLPAELRAQATESLGPCLLPDVRRQILDAYYEGEPRLLLAALRAMGASADEDWLEYVLEQLQSPDPDLRFEAATAAGSIGSEDAIPDLAVLLEDEDVDLAAAAVAALGEIGGSESKRLLRAFATHAPPALDEVLSLALELADERATDDDADDDDEEAVDQW